MRAYIMSIIAVVAFMFHFWYMGAVYNILWAIAGFFSIWSIYDGVITRMVSEEKKHRALSTSAVVIGVIVLLGLTISKIWSSYLGY
ncbi:MAG: hypothetical protein COT45_06480 [bacterium (Candidatus Stahlbacteria) CG08_land_8_20_14_0_20_40_26]|nr:MAG: hypothetical protein COX49_04090 [bacterium (Candidatus Stahlbacteria) CG23_combo_of_CG06-09_8_20_14_all_40_9]PIS23465.1 MAG: hypothetical protein COT45_06480 [bacterium (Candidatus Stahlbacteria) CG08_land_8_20_14_0_20_40_26]